MLSGTLIPMISGTSSLSLGLGEFFRFLLFWLLRFCIWPRRFTIIPTGLPSSDTVTCMKWVFLGSAGFTFISVLSVTGFGILAEWTRWTTIEIKKNRWNPFIWLKRKLRNVHTKTYLLAAITSDCFVLSKWATKLECKQVIPSSRRAIQYRHVDFRNKRLNYSSQV